MPFLVLYVSTNKPVDGSMAGFVLWLSAQPASPKTGIDAASQTPLDGSTLTSPGTELYVTTAQRSLSEEDRQYGSADQAADQLDES